MKLLDGRKGNIGGDIMHGGISISYFTFQFKEGLRRPCWYIHGNHSMWYEQMRRIEEDLKDEFR